MACKRMRLLCDHISRDDLRKAFARRQRKRRPHPHAFVPALFPIWAQYVRRRTFALQQTAAFCIAIAPAFSYYRIFPVSVFVVALQRICICINGVDHAGAVFRPVLDFLWFACMDP